VLALLQQRLAQAASSGGRSVKVAAISCSAICLSVSEVATANAQAHTALTDAKSSFATAVNDTRACVSDLDREVRHLRDRTDISTRLDSLESGMALLKVSPGNTAAPAAPASISSTLHPLPARPVAPLPSRGGGRGGAPAQRGGRTGPNGKRPFTDAAGPSLDSASPAKRYRESTSVIVAGPHESSESADVVLRRILSLLPGSAFDSDVISCVSEGPFVRATLRGDDTAARLASTWLSVNPLAGTDHLLTVRRADERDETISKLFGASKKV